jgi:hypothetical protein
MRVELAGLICEAHGPIDTRASNLRLSTLPDGTITAVKRKTAMTGDRIYPIHAWTRLHWIAVDAYWRALPRRIRKEWGRCTRHTVDCVESNLDTFRHVNMPRAILGMPILRLPPTREDSHALYLETPHDNRRTFRRKPTQLWVHGLEKPEPPWAPGDPLEPIPNTEHAVDSQKPFNVFAGDHPNALVPSPFCDTRDCPATVNHCRPLLHAWPYADFVTYPGRDYFTWESQLDPVSGDRTTPWLVSHVVESLQRWGSGDAYEKIMASHIYCAEGIFREHDIPTGKGWCIELIFWSAPAVRLSYAYYWAPLSRCCADGPYQLWAVENVQGSYPWAQALILQADGPPPDTPYPCGPHWVSEIDTIHSYAACIADLENQDNWCGLLWSGDDWVNHLVPAQCGGPGFSSCTPIMCSDAGPNAGFYYFLVWVNKNRVPVPLLYRKPTTWWQAGPYGHYWLVDPDAETTWAPQCVLVWAEDVDWPKRDPNTALNVSISIAEFIALEIAIGYGLVALKRVAQWAGVLYPYGTMPIQQAAGASGPIMDAMTSEAWRCSVATAHGTTNVIKLGDPIAIEARHRLSAFFAARHLVP